MENDFVTCEAAEKLLSPACAEVIVHVPLLTNVIVDPETVHTEVVDEVFVTGNPEVDVEVIVVEFSLRIFAVMSLKLIVCPAD
jgi:hypothetical protein